MAIIGTATGPYILDALDEEVTIGPGQLITNLNLSDTEVTIFNVSSTAGTWTITTTASLDGVEWFPLNVAVVTAFPTGNTISASGGTISNIYQLGQVNIPYLRLKMTAYTSGVVTLGPFITRRQGTR